MEDIRSNKHDDRFSVAEFGGEWRSGGREYDVIVEAAW